MLNPAPDQAAQPALSGSDPTKPRSQSPLDQAVLNRRAKLGVFLLAARTALQQLVTLVGNVYLARVLGPSDFGAFWIIQFALSFFTLFGDAGFGAALIQKKDTATDEELSSVFWSQVALALLVVLAVFLSAPYVIKFWPDLPRGADWMLRALSISLLFTTVRVIPAILMERELLFGRLSLIDLLLTLTFYGSAMILAHLGYGPFALVTAVLAQGVVGLLAAYSLRPWFPRFHWNWSILRPIFKFGIAFQTKNIIGFVNAAVIPLYAGRALGRYALGIVTWSQNTAFFPMQLVAIMSRVNFPLLSRLQHDGRAFSRSLERTIQMCALVTLAFVALFLGIGPSLVKVIYGNRWIPAVPTLYVFATAISIGFVSPIVNGALDALGKPRIMMWLGLIWTAMNWLVIAITMQFRTDAFTFSIAYCVHIVVANLVVVLMVRRLLPTANVWSKIRTAVLAATLATAVGRWLILRWITGPFTLIAAALLILTIFSGAVALFDRSAFLEIVAQLRKRRHTAALSEENS